MVTRLRSWHFLWLAVLIAGIYGWGWADSAPQPPSKQSTTGLGPTQPGTPAAPSYSEQQPLTSPSEPPVAGGPLAEYIISREAALAPVKVTDDYPLGSGDVLQVDLLGLMAASYKLPVSPQGTIFVPDMGQFKVAGLAVAKARQLLERECARRYRDCQLSLAVDTVRSIKVYAMGQLVQPGIYTVPATTRVLELVAYAKGTLPTASTRRLEIRRDGRLAATADLLEMRLTGNVSQNIQLEAGDVVFAPVVGAVVNLGGKLKRPGLYELRPGETLGEAIQEAGGTSPDACLAEARLSRIRPGQGETFIPIDLPRLLEKKDSSTDLKLEDGDQLMIPSLDAFEGSVAVSGEAKKTGDFEFKLGMTLGDLLALCAGPTPEAAPEHAYLERTRSDGQREMISMDITAHSPVAHSEMPLQNGDRLHIPGLSAYQQIIQVVGELDSVAEQQAKQLAEIAKNGPASQQLALQTPRMVYHLRQGEGLLSVVRHLGGPTARADLAAAAIERIDQDGRRQLIKVDLGRLLASQNAAQDVPLTGGDTLIVPRIKDWVAVVGEVNQPGSFDYREGLQATDYLARAGGPTKRAKLQNSRILREVNGKLTTVPLDLGRAMKGKTGALVAVQPGDTLIVTERKIAGWEDWAKILGALSPLGYIFRPVP